MKRFWPVFIAILISSSSAFLARAGTLTYVAIPATQSDANCGITSDHGYTTAIDGGNTRGTDRTLNGITLYSLSGAGQNTATADNCTFNALAGTLTDAGLTSKSIGADGTFREVMSDIVFNNAGGDNSQVEIVLDPESLEEGSTYDLRVYIASSSGQNRQVNLAFFGDGQDGVETGFFNEDDARTSPGRFQTAAQVYYINYRYTWDGDSTPGITITQKFGGAPFCLYALTNELVEEAGATAAGGAASDSLGQPSDMEGGAAEGEGEELAAGGEEGAAEGEGDEGMSAGFVEQESDQIGVESDDFYQSESLNSNGRWVKLSKWGTCWQPTSVSAGWTPYTNGSWKECEDCGWTFVSDEPWAWACYHYGRWAKVGIGCGWAWVPGTVWAPSWVSWRQGRSDSSCGDCIGWAPLPPEAGCTINVGISSWVDSTCNIGPDYYTFINIRDFGSDSYWGCNCIYDRVRNPGIIIDTFNLTNICYNRHVNIYCGGPDYNWCNTRIRQLGGRECGRVYVNRYDNVNRLGGKWARREGEQLGLVAPRIRGNKNPRFRPKIAESAGADKIDHGWKGIKDRKQEQRLRNHIAQETKGKNPRNSPAKLPQGAAEKMAKHGGGRHGKIIGAEGTGRGARAAQGGGGGLRPGGKGGRRGQGAQAGPGQGGARQAGPGQQAQGRAGGDQHPGKRGRRGQGQMGGGAAAGTGGQAGAAGFDQHPGKGRARGQGRRAAGGQMAGAGGTQAAGPGGRAGAGQAAGAGGGRRRPGQSLGRKRGGGAGAGAATAGGAGGATQGAGAAGAGRGGQQPGGRRGRGQRGAQGGQQGAGGGPAAQGAGATGTQAQAGAQGAGRRGGQGRRNRGQGQGQGQGGAFSGAQTQGAPGQQMQPRSGGQTQGGGGKRQAQRRERQRQQGMGAGQGQPGGGQAQSQAGAGQRRGGAGGQGRRRQQQQQMQQAGGQAQGQGQFRGAQAQGQGGGQRRGGGGGGGARRQQQLQQQQAQQQQRAQQQQQRQLQQQQQRQLQQQQMQQQRQMQQQQRQQLRQQQMQQGGGGGGRGGRGGGGGGGGRRRGQPTPTPPG